MYSQQEEAKVWLYRRGHVEWLNTFSGQQVDASSAPEYSQGWCLFVTGLMTWVTRNFWSVWFWAYHSASRGWTKWLFRIFWISIPTSHPPIPTDLSLNIAKIMQCWCFLNLSEWPKPSHSSFLLFPIPHYWICRIPTPECHSSEDGTVTRIAVRKPSCETIPCFQWWSLGHQPLTYPGSCSSFQMM